MTSPDAARTGAPPQGGGGLRSWSLRRRLGASLLAAGALIVGVVAASFVLLIENREQQQLVTGDYYEAAREGSDYYNRLSNARAAVDDYVGTREPGALRAFRQLEATDPPWRPGATAAVTRHLVVDPDASARIVAVEAAAQVWYSGYARAAIADREAGRPIDEARRAEGGRLWNDVQRSHQQGFLTALRNGRAEALAHLLDLNALLFYAVLVSAVVAIATAALLWGLLRTWVSTPVANLAAETRIVGRGRLDHEVSVDGPPEFVRLAADVEAMRRRLVSQIAAVEAAGREVSDARARLEDQAAELRRSNQELEQFAYVASHDLQEPLRKVASFCQLLQKRYAGQLDSRADQYIEFAVDGAKRMQRLINDLLDFSRVGRMTAGPVAAVDLEDCLATALGNLEAAREEAGAQIAADPLPTVRGEAPLLTQVLQNLVGNGLKFRVEDRPPRIRITCRRVGEHWEFACADNGIGIAPEYAERVFVIFQRLHPKDVYGGTGIGLAMCKKIIEYHGGRIWVDTDPDPELDPDDGGDRLGTVIRWTLPAEVAPDAGSPDADPDRHPVPVRMGQ